MSLLEQILEQKQTHFVKRYCTDYFNYNKKMAKAIDYKILKYYYMGDDIDYNHKFNFSSSSWIR